jgi:hypothetical protein
MAIATISGSNETWVSQLAVIVIAFPAPVPIT